MSDILLDIGKDVHLISIKRDGLDNHVFRFMHESKMYVVDQLDIQEASPRLYRVLPAIHSLRRRGDLLHYSLTDYPEHMYSERVINRNLLGSMIDLSNSVMTRLEINRIRNTLAIVGGIDYVDDRIGFLTALGCSNMLSYLHDLDNPRGLKRSNFNHSYFRAQHKLALEMELVRFEQHSLGDDRVNIKTPYRINQSEIYRIAERNTAYKL